jgi:hypothetical protein
MNDFLRKILIISLSEIDSDPRVFRQISFLKNEYDIYTIGFGNYRIEGVKKHFQISREQRKKLDKIKKIVIYKLGLFENYYWDGFGIWGWKAKVDREEVNAQSIDLVIANEIDALPLALSIANGVPVLYDAHEFSPQEFEDRFLWRFLRKGLCEYLCKTYIAKAQAMTTVCEGIAHEYRKQFSVNPSVITNAADFADLTPSQVSDKQIRIIHHGGAIPSRKLETMIEMMEYLDNRYSLYFMLVPIEPGYYKKLREKAEKNSRIFFIPPVEMKQLPFRTNQFDIGLFLLPPTNFNYKHALPNKFYEFVQARLAIAIGPSPEMAAIVKEYDLGVVSKSFEPQDMAKCLNALTAGKIMHFKTQSHLAARALSADENKNKLLKIVTALIRPAKND